MELTPKQEAFCNYYIETGNASEAYRRAFCCARMKPNVVNVKAVELLNNGKITVRVKELKDELKQKSDLSKERILNELKCILDSKITDYVDLQGGKLIFKDFSSLSESQIKAIESIKQGRNGIELKLHGKSWTIEQICRMLGYDAPTKQEITGKDGKDLIPQIEIEIIDKREDVDHEDTDE